MPGIAAVPAAACVAHPQRPGRPRSRVRTTQTWRAIGGLLLTTLLAAAEPPAPPTRTDVAALASSAQRWLLTQAQPDGRIGAGSAFHVGITALAAQALTASPEALPADHPVIAGALRFLAAHRQPDGGVYAADEGLGNYGTALTLELVMRLPDTARGGIDPAPLRRYLQSMQNGDAASAGHGGAGYVPGREPGDEDLPNTVYGLHALRAAGLRPDDAYAQRALAFLERCQDRSSDANHAPWVRGTGGGVYGPQDAARSWASVQAGAAAGDTPRYVPTAAMTYALISGYLALDLKPDDPRIVAALGWLAPHWGFDANPGMAPGREQQGLFHLHALAARTCALLPPGPLTLPDGRVVDWRADLFAAIARRAQRTADGGAFWINAEQRWGEGDPTLVTAYALTALKTVARGVE